MRHRRTWRPLAVFALVSAVSAVSAAAFVAIGPTPTVAATPPSSGVFAGPAVGIPTSGPANPYPAAVEVSGLHKVLTKVEVSLVVSHTWPNDIDILLVGPHGQNLIIMSDVGGSNTISNVAITISDDAPGPLPLTGPLTAGAYRPTNLGPGLDGFPSPAPTPSDATMLETFRGTDPNGVWNLFVTDDTGPDSGSISSWSLSIEAEPHLFNPVEPARVFDTRPTTPAGTRVVAKQKITAGDFLSVQLTGTAGVPTSGVAAVALNVTVNAPEGDGFVTVYPCTDQLPPTSSVNFRAGQTVPNPVIAPVQAVTGRVCFYAARTTHLFVDVTGWFADLPIFHPVQPTRLVDTRPTQPQGAISVPKGKRAENTTLQFTVAGQAGLPGTGVRAVALNVTVNAPEGDGYVTVYPCGDVPPTSSVNFRRGQTVANAVIVPLSPLGALCVRAARTTHVIIDMTTWFAHAEPAFLGFNGVAPVRVLDTRPNAPAGTVAVPKVKLTAGVPLSVKVTDTSGLPPTGIGAVVMNVTVNGPEQAGFLTVYPCGPLPPTSSVNYRTSQTVANAVISPVSAGGTVCFYSARNTHLIVDLSGYFSG